LLIWIMLVSAPQAQRSKNLCAAFFKKRLPSCADRPRQAQVSTCAAIAAAPVVNAALAVEVVLANAHRHFS
jgi:hypothetical protein